MDPRDSPFAPFAAASAASSSPSDTVIMGGSASFPTANADASSNTGSFDSGENSDADSSGEDVATITTTGFFGAPTTYTTTLDAFTTKDPLAPDSTALSRLSFLNPSSTTRRVEPSGPETTYTTTNSLGSPTVVIAPLTIPQVLPSSSGPPTPTMASSSLPSTVNAANPTAQSQTTLPTQPSTDQHHSGISHGAIAAAVVVPVVVVLACLACLFVFFRRRRSRQRSHALEAPTIAIPPETGPSGSPPPPYGEMRESSRDYFQGHSIPAAGLGPGVAPEAERHPLENVRTGPPPAAFRSSGLGSDAGSREVSAAFSSSSGPLGAIPVAGTESPYSTSAGSDPFRDPRLGMMGASSLAVESTNDVGSAWSNFTSGPVSPVGPASTSPEQRQSYSGPAPVSPPTRQASKISAISRATEDGEADDASIISVGEAAVGDVRTQGVQRASVVHLRRGSESVSQGSGGSPTTPRRNGF